MQPNQPNGPYQQFQAGTPQQVPQQSGQYGQLPPQNNMYPGNLPGQAPYKPKKHSHVVWIVSVVLLALSLCGALGFGIWAFMERDTFKTQTDEIVAREVEIAVQRNSSVKDNEFLEREKEPLKTYSSPAAVGSVVVSYPKTWSAFVTESDGNTPVDGYFHPNFVPGVRSETAFALRVEIINRTYDSELSSRESDVRNGKVTVQPFRAEQVSQVLGSRIDGEINKDQQGSMVLFPIRDKTLKISTQSESFKADFDNIILKQLTFTP